MPKKKLTKAEEKNQTQIALAAAQLPIVRVMKLRYSTMGWIYNPCKWCKTWCVSNDPDHPGHHPICWEDPERLKEVAKVERARKKAVNPDQDVLL